MYLEMGYQKNWDRKDRGFGPTVRAWQSGQVKAELTSCLLCWSIYWNVFCLLSSYIVKNQCSVTNITVSTSETQCSKCMRNWYVAIGHKKKCDDRVGGSKIVQNCVTLDPFRHLVEFWLKKNFLTEWQSIFKQRV